MAGFSFSLDMHFLWRGREYVVKESLPNGDLRILDIAFDESRSEKYQCLVKALYDGELEFLGDSATTREQRQQFSKFGDDFTMLDESDARKAEAKRRLAYVTAVVNAELDTFSEKTVSPILQRVHDEIKDKKPKPHWKTVIYVYVPRWRRSNQDVRSLQADYHKQGNRNSKALGERCRKRKGECYSRIEKAKAREVQKVVDDEIERLLKRGKRASVPELHDAVQLAIVTENGPEAAKDRLPFPTERAVRYCVDRLGAYDKDRLLHGKAYADKKYKSNGPRAEYTRVLERVEFDDSPTDLLVVDTTTRLPLGRATETFGVDCYSGMPYGSHTGFDGTGFLPVGRAFLHGIQPKTYIKELFPEVEGEWPVYGVPQEIGVDNGAGYISSDLADACSQLGTNLDYCPPRDPDGKPYVENFARNLAQKLLHKLDGTTFANFLDKGDYDPSTHAVISFDAYMELKHLMLVDLWPHEVNRGRHNRPITLWQLGVKNYPPAMPRKLQELRVLLGKIEMRVITNSGIAFECLAYNSDELKLLRRDLGSGSVKFKYDPAELAAIHVYDPRTDKYLTVPALDQAYANGLSLWQHQIIKRFVREELNMDSEDPVALIRAKKKIQDIVDKEWIKTGKSNGVKRRLARYMGIRQPDYDSVLKMWHEESSSSETRPSRHKEPETLTSNVPLAMDANSDCEGSSDFEEEFIAPDGSEDDDAIDEDTESEAKSSLINDANESNSHEESQPIRFTEGDSDDDVDTAGFDANFFLPKQRSVMSDAENDGNDRIN